MFLLNLQNYVEKYKLFDIMIDRYKKVLHLNGFIYNSESFVFVYNSLFGKKFQV